MKISKELYLKMPEEMQHLFCIAYNASKEEVLEVFPHTKSGTLNQASVVAENNIYGKHTYSDPKTFESNSGSASRFFYAAKCSSKDRHDGCDGLESNTEAHNLSSNACGRCGLRIKANGSGVKCECGELRETIQLPRKGNHHPTVKNVALMTYLCRLITPPNGLILDPFMGSGSTGKAAMLEGFHFVGIEKEPEYFEIAEKRIAHALKTATEDCK